MDCPPEASGDRGEIDVASVSRPDRLQSIKEKSNNSLDVPLDW